MSRIKKEKNSLIDAIIKENNVPNKFKNTIKKTLLKLSHKDISNLTLGFIIYKTK